MDDATELLVAQQLFAGELMLCDCGFLIFKDGGCNYVQCRCGAEWCWQCRRRKYTQCNETDHNSH